MTLLFVCKETRRRSHLRLTTLLASLPTVQLVEFVFPAGGRGFLRQSWQRSRQRYELVMVYGGGLASLVWTLIGPWRSGAQVCLWLGGNHLATFRSTLAGKLRQGRLLELLRGLVSLLSLLLAERLASAIIVNNEPLAREIRRQAGRVPVLVIPSTVRELGSAPGPARVARRVEAPCRLLIVTNLQWAEKAEGVVWLMRQLARLARQGTLPCALHLTLCGDGLYLERVRQAAGELAGMAGLTVTLMGYDKEIAGHYHQADLFLYHSTLDGLASVLLEAAWAGLPILVNRHEAHSTVLREQVEARFYDPADPSSFDRALLDLLTQPEQARQLGERARHLVATRYSLAAQRRTWEQFLASGLREVTLPPWPDPPATG